MKPSNKLPLIPCFDLHADIGYDMQRRKNRGEPDLFEIHHRKLQRGGIGYVAVVCFFDGNQTWEEMQEMILTANETLSTSDVVLVQDNNLDATSEKLHCIIAVEGMCGIRDDVTAKIDWLADHNVKLASLTWNEENALATGVRGNVNRGITGLGKEALDAMAHRGMVLDVSHLNECSFWDVVRYYTGTVIATHSNAKHLCGHDRNLSDQQMRAIANRDGIVGLNAYRNFVSSEIEHQTVQQLAKHALYMKDLIGSEHIALGFDYMDYFEGSDDMVQGLHDCTMTQSMLEALFDAGFEEAEVRAIASENALSVFFSEDSTRNDVS